MLTAFLCVFRDKIVKKDQIQYKNFLKKIFASVEKPPRGPAACEKAGFGGKLGALFYALNID
jgi:hypothetical protein